MVIKLAIYLLIILSIHAEDVFINTTGLRGCAVKNGRMWDPIADIPCNWACMGKGCDRGECEKRWHIVDGQKKFDFSSTPSTADYRWICVCSSCYGAQGRRFYMSSTQNTLLPIFEQNR